jgi:hypothetical protein
MVPIKKFTIYGERCSGTNYLEDLITRNFDVEVTWEYGWKHFFGFKDLSNSDDTLFIGIVREQHSWLNSFYKNPYHLHASLKEKKISFLFSEFWSIYDNGEERKDDRNIYTKKKYKNIFEMRHTKLKFLIEDMPKKVKNYILIRYEDLMNSFEYTMNRIKNCGLGFKENINFPVNSDNYKGDIKRKYNKNEKKICHISKKMIYSSKAFNPYYEIMLGYIIPNPKYIKDKNK